MSFQLDRLANQLDWNLLRTFMVIVQERSITGAALRLNITQPSVSAALRRLEERLDIQLVERGSGRVFTITNAGEIVYREALEMYGGVVRLNELNKTDSQAVSGNIVIYRSVHLDIGFLNAALAEFRNIHPAVTVSINSVTCSEVVRSLQQRVASLGFCTRLESAPRLKQYQLEAKEYGFYCGPQHPLYKIENPSSQLLSASDVVGFEGETLGGPLAPIVRYRARHGIGDTMVATTTSLIDLIDMIRHTSSIGSIAVTHAQQHAPDLWAVPLSDPRPVLDIYALVDEDRHVTMAEHKLLEFLHARGVLI